MSGKPIIHGRDHRVGGADPIGLLGVEYAYVAQDSPQTLASGVVFYWDLDGAVTGTPVTASPQTFTLTALTGAGASNKAVQINQSGFYSVEATMQVSAESASATVKTRTTNIEVEGTGSLVRAGIEFGGNLDHMILGKQSFSVLIGVDDSTGPVVVGLKTTNNEVSSASGIIAMLITRLDARDWSTLPIPP